jgi:DNA-binding FadR family transcriptional regulator
MAMVSQQEIREVYEICKHFESDVYFHDTIVNFVENRLLKEVLDGLTNRISIVRRFAQLQPGYG